jgi:two-component system response regulator FixJ
VLDLVVEGMSNKAIANALGLSAKTVEVHRAKVMEKMHARSISDLVKMAMQNQFA